MMGGVWLWVRSEWRRGWLELLALAVLIALVGGVTMAVAAGARRADTALDRFMDATNHPQAQVESIVPDDLAEMETWAGSLPSAEELADRLTAVRGVEGVTVLTFIGAAAGSDGEFFNVALGAQRGPGPMPLVLDGRWADPADPNEVVVNETAAASWGSIGEQVSLRTLGPEQIEVMAGLSSDEPAGPAIDVRVVGIMRDIEGITDAPEPVLITTPAFVERYSDEVLMFTGLASVTAPSVPLDVMVDELDAAAGEGFVAYPFEEDFAGRADDAISVEVTALWVFAAAILAGLIVPYQAMVRQGAQHSDEAFVRHAIGFTRRDQVLGAMLRASPAIAVGTIGGAGLAIALSPVFPRGLARRAEVAPGVWLDPAVLLVGALLVAIVGLSMAATTGWLVTPRAAGATGRPTAVPPVALGRAAAALPPAAGLGLRSALAPRGRWTQAGWAGLTGVAVAVAGLLAVAAVDRSADRLLSTPRLFGAGWDAVVELSDDADADGLVAELAADADVAAVGRQDTLALESVDVSGPGGPGTAEPEAVEPLVGSIAPTLVAGRLPAGPSEVAIGTTVATTLGADIGDTVEVAGHDGPVELVVVGRILNAGTNDLGNGFTLTRAGLDSLTAGCPPDSDEIGCLVMTEALGVSFKPDVDRDTAINRLAEITPAIVATPVPSSVLNLDQIGSTPWMLAGFLGLLGVAGLIHAMASGSRRRDHDLAVGRALGFQPGQAAAGVRWQAVTLAAAGAFAGVVLGVVAGRVVWQRVAVGTGAVVETVLPFSVMLAAPAAVIVVALVIAVPSGWRASRQWPSVILRSE